MLEVDSEDPDALRLAAAALRATGKSIDAQKYELHALENWHKTPELLTAARAMHDDRHADAEISVRARIEQAPEDLSALSMLASIAARAGALEEAERLHNAVLDRAPEFLPSRIELLQLLDEQTRFAEAKQQVDELRRREPDNMRWLHHSMSLLVRMGRFTEALNICQTLLKENAADQTVLIARGNILKTLGRNAECIETFKDSIRLDPSQGEAWWSLANLKTYSFSDAEIAMMEAQQKNVVSDKQRVNLDFALGSAYEKRGDARVAFEHYTAANALWLKQIGHDPDWISQTVDSLVETIDQNWFARFASGGSQNTVPIFVLGMPRAGSTLIDQILSSHSHIEGTAELPYIPALSRSINYRGGENSPAKLIATLSEETRNHLGREYLDRAQLHRFETLPMFIDKTPNNWFFLPLIRAILPNAKIIDVRRDAMACCFSNFKQHYARGQSFTYSLEHVGQYYRDYVRLMDHLDVVAPDYVHRIKYEDLVANTESEVRRTLEYLGLEFESACLEFYKNERAVRTASAEQVRRPISAGSNDAWRPFDPWLGPLREALGDLTQV